MVSNFMAGLFLLSFRSSEIKIIVFFSVVVVDVRKCRKFVFFLLHLDFIFSKPLFIINKIYIPVTTTQKKQKPFEFPITSPS